MSYPYLDFEMKKIKFTDSSFKDFEFRFFDKVVYFFYMNTEGKVSVNEIIHIDLIANNMFPPSLESFPEARQYLRCYIDNIAFT